MERREPVEVGTIRISAIGFQMLYQAINSPTSSNIVLQHAYVEWYFIKVKQNTNMSAPEAWSVANRAATTKCAK